MIKFSLLYVKWTWNTPSAQFTTMHTICSLKCFYTCVSHLFPVEIEGANVVMHPTCSDITGKITMLCATVAGEKF